MHAPWLIAVNKVDLCNDPDASVRAVALHHAPTFSNIPAVVGISAKSGQGTDALIDVIKGWVTDVGMSDQSAVITVNDRHRAAILRAKDCIAQSLAAIEDDHAPELAAFETRNAAIALGEIIGETTTEDVLSEVFAKFCIGK
jgi:tRNA modification GTPase